MNSLRQMLQELMLVDHKANKITGPVLDERVGALNAMYANFTSMKISDLKEAMTTAHFSAYFADALSRAFYADYAYQTGAWQAYTYADEAPDFRDVSRFRMSEPEELLKRREKAESKATYIEESEIYYGVEEFSRQFDVSWRAILNDDLGKIKETPARMAKAAGRWLDSWVSALYDNAVTQASLLALGLLYGGTGRLTMANLAIGINAMKQRTDVRGNPMNIRAVHLVIPTVLEVQAASILQDLLSYGGPGGNIMNQFIAGVHTDPYIAFASPNVPWYLIAAPAEIPAVTVARLAGMPGPIVFKTASNIELLSGSAPAALLLGSAATGDIEYTVLDIVGGWDDATYVGVTDFRGIYYSNGTTV